MSHGPLTRCEKLQVAHAPRMPGTFIPPPRVSDPDMHHDTCVTHVPWCMPGSLTSGFLWSQWRGKRSRHSRSMRNLQFCVSGMRPIWTEFYEKLDSLIVIISNIHVHVAHLVVIQLVEKGSCVIIHIWRHGVPYIWLNMIGWRWTIKTF